MEEPLVNRILVSGTAIDHYTITHTAWQCNKNDYILISQNIWWYYIRCARCNLKFCNEYTAEAYAINGQPSFTVFVLNSWMEIWKVNCTKCVQNNTFVNRSCLRETYLPTKWFTNTGAHTPSLGPEHGTSFILDVHNGWGMVLACYWCC